MIHPRITRLILPGLTLMMTWHCAAQRAPGGGPVDKTPPEFISANVETGTTGIPAGQEFVFSFSEALDELSVKKGLTLFPLNMTEMTVRTRGRRIIIRPNRSWAEDQAYSLILDNSVSDMRKNPLNGSIAFSFSTGSTIPGGRLSGKVYGLKKNENATILLADTENIDSLFVRYKYFSQSGTDGKFSFSYLPETKYYLMGYIDKDQSRSYSPLRDDLVLPDRLAAMATDSMPPYIEMKVVRGNFTEPQLLSARRAWPGRIDLKFSKYLPVSQNFDSLKMDTVSIDTIIAENEYLRIYYQASTDEDSLQIHVPALKDTLNCVSLDTTVLIRTQAYIDTSYSLSWQDPYVVISPDPGADSLPAVIESKEDTSRFVLLPRKGGRYFCPLEGTFQGQCSLTLAGSPLYPEIPDSSHRSVQISRNEDPGSGSLALTVPKQRGEIYILISGKNRYSSAADADGHCDFPAVIPGTYSLISFRDRNGNGIPDNGSLQPFTAPEIVRPASDNLEIRRNWETSLDLTKTPDNQNGVNDKKNSRTEQ